MYLGSCDMPYLHILNNLMSIFVCSRFPLVYIMLNNNITF